MLSKNSPTLRSDFKVFDTFAPTMEVERSKEMNEGEPVLDLLKSVRSVIFSTLVQTQNQD